MLGLGKSINKDGFVAEPVIPEIDQNNIAIAFSVARRVVDTYTGNALKIRVDTTGQPEYDIGFDSEGNLDTASIASNSGSNNAYVVTLYNQSGNNKHASPNGNVATEQPQIYDGSSVIKMNEKPAIKYTGTTAATPPGNSEHLNFDASSISESNFSVFLAFKYDNHPEYQMALNFGDGAGGTNYGWLGYSFNSSSDIRTAYAGDSGNGNPVFFPQDLGSRALLANLMSITAGTTSNSGKYYFNGSVLKVFSHLGTNTLNATANLGGYDIKSLPLRGRISEMIMYSADKNDSAASIHADMRNFYSLY